MADVADDSGANAPEGPEIIEEFDDLDDLDEEPAGTESESFGADELVFLGGDSALEVSEVDEIAAALGATIVLVAGSQEAGKTSLLVALYDQFLVGDYAGYSFAESRTLDAFDSRQFGSRLHSNGVLPGAVRTEERELRFLHLRLAEESGELHDLVATDIWGEVFEELATGTSVTDNIPIAPRIDRVVLLVDGKAVADKARRQTAEREAAMILGALLEDGGVEPNRPILIVVSKSDQIVGDDAAWCDAMAGRLVDVAMTRGATQVETALVAAMPTDGGDPRGLERVLQWMLVPIATAPSMASTRSVVSSRTFLSAEGIS